MGTNEMGVGWLEILATVRTQTDYTESILCKPYVFKDMETIIPGTKPAVDVQTVFKNQLLNISYIFTIIRKYCDIHEFQYYLAHLCVLPGRVEH